MVASFIMAICSSKSIPRLNETTLPQAAVDYAMQDFRKAVRRAKVKLGAQLKAKDPRSFVFEDAELEKIHRDAVAVAFKTFSDEAVRVRGRK